MINDLLDLASTMAHGANEAGRPKSVELRRAISTVYYALFHALCFLCADQLVGKKPWKFFPPIYRAVDHRSARSVLGEFRRTEPGSVLASIALTFSQLQDARHDADYNPEPFRFNRSGTIELVEAGRQAVSLLATVTPDQKLTLAVRLVARLR